MPFLSYFNHKLCAFYCREFTNRPTMSRFRTALQLNIRPTSMSILVYSGGNVRWPRRVQTPGESRWVCAAQCTVLGLENGTSDRNITLTAIRRQCNKLKQGVTLTERNTTGPLSRAAPGELRCAMKCYRRRQTHATITSLPLLNYV